MKKLGWIVALLAGVAAGVCAPGAVAQGALRKDRVQAVDGRAMGGQQITVCAYSAGDYASGVYTGTVPCPSQTAIYYDPAESEPITQPLLTDSQGNYAYAAAAGNYTECVAGSSVTPSCYQVSIGGSGGGASAGVAPNQNVTYISPNCGTQANCFTAVSGAMFGDCTYASGSPTITCTSSDTLTPSMVGWRVFVTCCGWWGGTNHIGSALEVNAATTISAVNNSAHTVTMSNNATNTRATVQGQVVVMGPLDDTAIANATLAALDSGQQCIPMQFAAGIYLVSQGFANTRYCTDAITSESTTGWSVTGAGASENTGSIIVPVPNFSFATCTGYSSACFFGIQGASIANLAIWGGDNSTSANGSSCGTNAKTITSTQTDTLLDHLLLTGWCANDTALRAITFTPPGNGCIYCVVDGAGGLGVEVLAGAGGGCLDCFFGDSNGVAVGGFATTCGLLIDSGANWTDSQTTYGGCGLNNYYVVNNGGTMHSVQDQCAMYSGVNGLCMVSHGSSITYLDQLISAGAPGFATDTVLESDTGAQVLLSKAQLTPGASGVDLSCSGGSFTDLGGNILSGTKTSGCSSSLWGPQVYSIVAATVSGCSLTAALSNNPYGGVFHSGTTGTCTVTITPGITSTNGWNCSTRDYTTPADTIPQTSLPTASTTAITIAGTTVSGDVIGYQCTQF